MRDLKGLREALERGISQTRNNPSHYFDIQGTGCCMIGTLYLGAREEAPSVETLGVTMRGYLAEKYDIPYDTICRLEHFYMTKHDGLQALCNYRLTGQWNENRLELFDKFFQMPETEEEEEKEGEEEIEDVPPTPIPQEEEVKEDELALV